MIALMILVFAVLIFVIISSALQPSDEEPTPAKSTCPPHQWSWQKMYNEDGTERGERITCAKCGPLRSLGE